MQRLQKFISQCGYASRRSAEKIILENRVKVNGKLVNELGFKVSGDDVVTIDGKQIKLCENKVYYLLNKPRGVISSSSDDKSRKTVVDIIKCDERIYPVGRLDYNTTGLLILTNDGELANLLMHPSNKVTKTYLAKIEGILSKDDIISLKKGIVIDNRRVNTSNFKVREKDILKNTSLVEITIEEGRNHIVKNIFSSLKHDVIRLTRIRYGFLSLNGLKSGEYRELSIKEVKKLYSYKNTK